jgi:peptidoglycan hydrolase CwlO-like protein
MPHAPVSWGELIDKITILEIKCARLGSEAAIANAAKELALLRQIAEPVMAETKDLTARLKALNESLWEIEDQIRDKEAAREFDAVFIALARSVYQTNDQRGAVKKQINLLLKSELTEEKGYKPY